MKTISKFSWRWAWSSVLWCCLTWQMAKCVMQNALHVLPLSIVVLAFSEYGGSSFIGRAVAVYQTRRFHTAKCLSAKMC